MKNLVINRCGVCPYRKLFMDIRGIHSNDTNRCTFHSVDSATVIKNLMAIPDWCPLEDVVQNLDWSENG